MRHFSVLAPALKQAEGAQQKHNKGSVESVVKFRNTEFLGSRVIDRFPFGISYIAVIPNKNSIMSKFKSSLCSINPDYLITEVVIIIRIIFQLTLSYSCNHHMAFAVLYSRLIYLIAFLDVS